MASKTNKPFPMEIEDVPPDVAENLMKYFTGMINFIYVFIRLCFFNRDLFT